MDHHTNPRINALLNLTQVEKGTYIGHTLREQESMQEAADSFLPEDIDELMQLFRESVSLPYRTATPVGLALIRLSPQTIRSLLVEHLETIDENNPGYYHAHPLARSIFLLGMGPYQGDQEVLDLLRIALNKDNLAVPNFKFLWVVAELGWPLKEYTIPELAGFAILKLGDVSKLENILFAQFDYSCGEKSKKKDAVVQLAYSLDPSTTIQVLNQIAGYESTSANHWRPMKSCLIDCLGELGEEYCIEPLHILFTQEEETANRIQALNALGKIGGESAIEIINKATGDDKSRVRRKAKKILKQISKV